MCIRDRSANRKLYMLRDDLELLFHASRAISAVAEILVISDATMKHRKHFTQRPRASKHWSQTVGQLRQHCVHLVFVRAQSVMQCLSAVVRQ